MKKSQAERLAAMVGAGQNVPRPSNLPDEDVKPESRKAVETESRELAATAQPGEKVERITVGTKARREIAHYWTIQGKIKRRSVADVVRDALVAEFGLPDGFTKDDI